MSLGIPKESLLQMKGDNTFEEMENLKTWLADEENIKKMRA